MNANALAEAVREALIEALAGRAEGAVRLRAKELGDERLAELVEAVADGLIELAERSPPIGALARRAYEGPVRLRWREVTHVGADADEWAVEAAVRFEAMKAVDPSRARRVFKAWLRLVRSSSNRKKINTPGTPRRLDDGGWS